MYILRNIYKSLVLFGINPIKIFRSVVKMPNYIRDYITILLQKRDLSFPFKFPLPITSDMMDQAGSASGQYFHQDLFVAQKIFQSKPSSHLDVGSRIDGFIAHIATFMPIDVLDIRRLESTAANINFRQVDLMNLPTEMLNSSDSLSCLHTIEHFGLGRYGDTIDYFGFQKGLNSLYSVLRPGGKMYFSTPIGRQRIEFNAHRVFSVDYLVRYFEQLYVIKEFAYIDDAGNLHTMVKLQENDIKANYGCNFGCGIFILEKK